MLPLVIAVLILSVVSYVLWVVTALIPHETAKNVVRAVVFLILIIIFLNRFGSVLNF